MTTINDCVIIDIPKIIDQRGNLAVIEGATIPFDFKRVYYLFDIPTGSTRGGHAHKEQHELLLPLSGSFDVILNDSYNKRTITLNKPDKGLLITTGIWRELENFSSGSVCLVLSSDIFDELDYIRNFDDFITFKN